MNISSLSHDDGKSEKYFHILPNLYDDLLDPYEYRLIGHYKRRGTCWEGTRKIAEHCHMSVGKVSQARKSLATKGLIRIEMLTRKDLKDNGLVQDVDPDSSNKICVVTVVDVWDENVKRYSNPQSVNTPVHVMNTPCSPDEHPPVHTVNVRITSIEEKPIEETDRQTAVLKSETPDIAMSPPVPDNIVTLPERPQIYAVYEKHIGTLTPLIVSEIKDAEQEFSTAWVTDAIILTAQKSSVRHKWRYARGILRGWKLEGKSEGTPKPRTVEEKLLALGSDIGGEFEPWTVDQFVSKPAKAADEPAA